MTGSSARSKWMFNELNMALCNRCHLWRPAERFGNRSAGPFGLDRWCKDCRSAHLKSPSPCGTPGWTRRQASHLLSRYRMTPAEWEDRFGAQGQGCYLCGTEDTPQWMVDHDHDCCPGSGPTCGRCVMGIACQECNTLEAALQRLIDRGGSSGLKRVLRRAGAL